MMTVWYTLFVKQNLWKGHVCICTGVFSKIYKIMRVCHMIDMMPPAIEF